MHSLIRSKKAGGILTKFWYPGMSVCMRLDRRLPYHPFFLSLKDAEHGPGVGWLFSSSGG